jgi:hypothetical protein
MRSKEEAHDYRYFPDPDLLPLVLDPAWVRRSEASLPELPDAKRSRFVESYGLSSYDAGVLTAESVARRFFEQAAAGRDAKLVANWTINDLLGRLGADGREIEDSPIAPRRSGELVGPDHGRHDLVEDRPAGVRPHVGGRGASRAHRREARPGAGDRHRRARSRRRQDHRRQPRTRPRP